VTSYQQALHFQPEFAAAHRNLAIGVLQLGNFEQGWPDYEWRWECNDFSPPPSFRQPAWNGSPLQGGTILLFTAQGLGDTFQCVRYAKLVKQQCARVVLACSKSLAPLLASCPGVDELIPSGGLLPQFDVH